MLLNLLFQWGLSSGRDQLPRCEDFFFNDHGVSLVSRRQPGEVVNREDVDGAQRHTEEDSVEGDLPAVDEVSVEEAFPPED